MQWPSRFSHQKLVQSQVDLSCILYSSVALFIEEFYIIVGILTWFLDVLISNYPFNFNR